MQPYESAFKIYLQKTKDEILKPYNPSRGVVTLEEIKKVIKQRPSYGHKRVEAMINRLRYVMKQPSVN